MQHETIFYDDFVVGPTTFRVISGAPWSDGCDKTFYDINLAMEFVEQIVQENKVTFVCIVRTTHEEWKRDWHYHLKNKTPFEYKPKTVVHRRERNTLGQWIIKIGYY